MAGNSRFDSTSASPEASFAGNYQAGQRGGYSSPTLDRSISFREGAESRMFSSGKATSRGSAILAGELPTLSQCLMLDPIVMGDKKFTRSGEVRRVLGFSVGSSSEDNSFSPANLKNSPPVAVEELKRLKASVTDTCVKASGRAKKLDEHLNKLNEYCEGLNSKKLLRNELSGNERPGSSNLKAGNQGHRTSVDHGNQKFEDRPKNAVLNKRIRTSVAETRTEFRNNALPRQQLLVSKDRDMLKDNIVDSDIVEEKIRKLPAGGDGWERKMKRKRSVGAAFPKPIGNDVEMKRTTHHRLSNEQGLQSSDSTHGFRSGASNGASSTSKLDSTSSPASSSARAAFKNEQEKSVHSRDISAAPNKERVPGKGNIKLSSLEDNHGICPTPVIKGKASRAPRTGSTFPINSATNVPRVSGTLESWEQPPGLNKNPSVNGASNRKRAMPAGSSSPPITQWVGQRPQKISRTRRTNLVSVSNHDEVQMQSEGCSPTEFGARSSSCGNNPPLLSKNAGNGIQSFKPKPGSLPSPGRLSESEESGVGENRTKEKPVGGSYLDKKAAVSGPDVGPPAIISKKNKVIKEETGDGLRRQGQSGRVSPFSRASISPMREKLDNTAPAKLMRNVKSGADKSGSKSGRPLKKLSDHKGFSRLGHVINGGSPDFNGESEDDHEELLSAANLACNSSFLACSSPFWKKVESFFTNIGTDQMAFLSEKLKLAEECGSPPQFSCHGNVQGDIQEKVSTSDSLSGRRNQKMTNEMGTRDSSDRVGFVEQLHNSSLLGGLETEKRHDMVTPLYQRVLSALIMEDEIEGFEENGFGRPSSFPGDSCHIDAESRYQDRLDFSEPIIGVQTPKNGNAHIIFSCNGNNDYNTSPSVQDFPHNNGELLQGGNRYVHSEVEVLVRLSRCDYDPQSLPTKNYGISSIDCHYEEMCLEDKLVLELQSVGLFLETVGCLLQPALDDREDKAINQDIVQLERGLHQQTIKKKTFLDKICKVLEEGKDNGRDPELVAMDKLVELAYKKLLATRGSFASKHGIAKVSKQVALAFAKRTLARCQKFEDLGISCFSEPPLRDVVYAAPTQIIGTDQLIDSDRLVASDALETSRHLSDQAFAKNGPIWNRGKKKEVLLDDVGGAVFRATANLGILGSPKGKRSERDLSVRNAVSKAAIGGTKGERKTKAKPKQKIAQLSTSGNGVNKFMHAGSGESAGNTSNRKRDVRFMSTGNIPRDSSKDIKEPTEFANLPLNDMDSMEELGVDSDIGAPQDLNSWFNFDVDGLQDHDSVGLEIPMDDLSELNMF